MSDQIVSNSDLFMAASCAEKSGYSFRLGRCVIRSSFIDRELAESRKSRAPRCERPARARLVRAHCAEAGSAAATVSGKQALEAMSQLILILNPRPSDSAELACA